jgi:hypothetical protein
MNKCVRMGRRREEARMKQRDKNGVKEREVEL